VEKIVAALSVKLSRGEEQRLKRRGTSNVEAYEFWWRAREYLGQGTREATAQARAMHMRAIELDPHFAAPHAGLAIASVAEYVNGWSSDLESLLAEAERSARRAIELDAQEPVGHMALGGVLLWQRKHDEALAAHKQAIALDPNYAQAYAFLASALMYAGRSAESLDPFHTAMRLDPHYSNMLLHLLAQAYFSMGDYEEAARHLRERITRNPLTDASRMLLAACYGHLGQLDEARSTWADLLKVNPAFSLAQRGRVLPYKNSRDFELIAEGLAKAGLP
jgi:adenylate cyclase